MRILFLPQAQHNQLLFIPGIQEWFEKNNKCDNKFNKCNNSINEDKNIIISINAQNVFIYIAFVHDFKNSIN